MTIRHLRIFVAVYRNLSVTRAARELHLAQPSVSLAIKELEEYYHICLFDRLSRRLYPTDGGERFFSYANHIVNLFDELEDGVRGWEDSSQIKIGSSITIGNYFMPGMIKAFRKEFPEVRVSVSIKNTADIQEKVLGNELDFAFVEGVPEFSQLVCRSVGSDRLCVVCGKGHKLAVEIGRAKEEKRAGVALEGLVSYDFIMREAGSAGREIWEGILSAHQIKMEPLWESVSTQAIIRAVIENEGISVLPYLLVKKELEEGRLLEIPVEGVSLERNFYLIYHQNKFLTSAVKALIRIGENLLRERLLCGGDGETGLGEGAESKAYSETAFSENSVVTSSE
ncbi:MAG: LysR family transcriptional regulator [Lachnospiraceae bacterium]|nr:LysR family transcriptional regulator [Lachnospiraceae bacterium]